MKHNLDTPPPVTRTRYWRWFSQILIAGLLLTSSILGLHGLEPARTARALAPGAAQSPTQPQMAPLRSQPQPGAALAVQEPTANTFMPPVDLSHLAADLKSGAMPASDLPKTFDWRSHNGKSYVTPAKDQQSCAACYAFAFVGQMEAKLLIDGAGRFDLSENHAKECNWTAASHFEYPPGSAWGSCNGGNSFMLANLFSQTGTVLESCDPFVAGNVGCGGTCPYQQTVLDWRLITAGPAPATAVLKRYVYEHGPLAVSMFIDLDGGFHPDYDGSFTLDYQAAPDRANHTVLLVGWSDRLPPVRGGVRPTEGWIVKNNWGPNWGDQGFAYLQYGAANLGAISSFVAEWQDYDPDGQLLHYDEGGWWHSWGCENTTAWALAKFSTATEASVERVEFWTTDATKAVDVFLYRDFDGEALNGLMASQSGNHFDEAGYHSVRLDEPVRVARGQQVVAVVKLTNKSYGFPVAGDPHGSLEPGRTYLSCEGHWWHDMGADYGADMGIRLRTAPVESSASAPAPEVKSITPNGGSSDGVLHISRLTGSNFLPGAVVKLTKPGEPDIQASNVVVTNDSQLACDIDLTGAESGDWDVRVNHPGGPAGVLENGFVIVSGAKTWNGVSGTDWHTPANWTPEGVPSRVENVTIPAVGNQPIISRGDAAVQNLTIDRGAVLDLTTRALHVEGEVLNNGILKQAAALSNKGLTPFLRLTNQAGDHTAYYGLDLGAVPNAADPEVARTTVLGGDRAGPDLTDPAANWYNSSQKVHDSTHGGVDASGGRSGEQEASASAQDSLTPAPNTQHPSPDTVAGGPLVTVAVAGNQECRWRTSSVKRCFDIRSSTPLRANVRFYFRDSERNGHKLDGLNAYRFGAQWAEVPGRYDRGAVDGREAQYIEVHDVDATSQFSLDRPSRPIGTIYLPVTLKYRP